MENFIKIVSRWEKKYGRRLPFNNELMCIMNFQNTKSDHFKENLCSYYSIFTGMDDDDYDDFLFSFWSYKKAIDTAKENFYVANKFWPFADYAYEAHIYACSYEDIESSFVYIIINWEIFKIANSIDEFFKLLLTDPEKVLVF